MHACARALGASVGWMGKASGPLNVLRSKSPGHFGLGKFFNDVHVRGQSEFRRSREYVGHLQRGRASCSVDILKGLQPHAISRFLLHNGWLESTVKGMGKDIKTPQKSNPSLTGCPGLVASWFLPQASTKLVCVQLRMEQH